LGLVTPRLEARITEPEKPSTNPETQMSNKLILSINVILALIILATLVWAFPYFASAFYMSRGNKALEAALERPEVLESKIRAVNYLQQAVRWDRNNAEASELLAKAYPQLAEAYVQRGQFTEARPALEVLLEQDPDDQFVLYYLAKAYEEAGERDKAAENYEKLRYFELEEGGAGGSAPGLSLCRGRWPTLRRSLFRGGSRRSGQAGRARGWIHLV